MGLTWADLEQRIRKLTREYRDSGDRIYLVECECGTVLGTTKVGRHQGRSKDVGHPVLKLIPRQLKIEPDLWREIAACTKSRADYIRARGHSDCLEAPPG